MPGFPFDSVDELQAALGEHSYLADRGLATAIYLSLSLGKPLLLEGEAGELFERLRSWRSAAAQSASVPAYVVFTDATLQAIAESRPTSLRELAGLPGIASRKLELYGADVLATVSG